MKDQYKLPFKWKGIIRHNAIVSVFSEHFSGNIGIVKRNLYEDSYGDYYITYHNKWEVVLQDSEGFLFITTTRKKL